MRLIIEQVQFATKFGLIESGYVRSVADNGFVRAYFTIYLTPNLVMTKGTECAVCHMYFTYNLIALSLPIPVLQYIVDHLKATRTKSSKRMPIHAVRSLIDHIG
jgi:hypothetical protein